MQTIHTLNSRGHIFLETMRDAFGIAAPEMRQEIQGMHSRTCDILSSKGIAYAELRSALVPNSDRHEAAFIFDSTAIEAYAYGREVFSHVLPLLDPRVTQSVLCGDLVGEDQELILGILQESLTLSRTFKFRHGTLLYAVYVNNLSDAALERLHGELARFPAYVGHIETSQASRAKTYLSLCMANLFVKHGRTIIVEHEDDRSNDENVNITLYPLDGFGYKVASLQSTYFGIFLSYKIERPVFGAFKGDSEMALNAISNDIAGLCEFDVFLSEDKHKYLLTWKLGKLRSAGLADVGREEIAALIQSKLNASYIYNLEYLEAYDLAKFSLMVEIDRSDGRPARRMAALAYDFSNRTLRVLTFY